MGSTAMTYTQIAAGEILGVTNTMVRKRLAAIREVHQLDSFYAGRELTEFALERLREYGELGKIGYAEKYRVSQANLGNEFEHPNTPSGEMERYRPPHLERLDRPNETRIEISAEQLVTLLATARTQSEIVSLQNRTETRDSNSQTLANTVQRIRDEQAYQRGRLNYRREREIESQGQHDEMQADLTLLLRSNQTTQNNEI